MASIESVAHVAVERVRVSVCECTARIRNESCQDWGKVWRRHSLAYSFSFKPAAGTRGHECAFDVRAMCNINNNRKREEIDGMIQLKIDRRRWWCVFQFVCLYPVIDWAWNEALPISKMSTPSDCLIAVSMFTHSLTNILFMFNSHDVCDWLRMNYIEQCRHYDTQHFSLIL